MHLLERNKQYFQYATASGKTAILDDDGYKTGEYSVSYANVHEARGNICLRKSYFKQTLQGISTATKSTIALDTLNTGIVEKTVIWVGFGHIGAFDKQTAYTVGQYCINGSGIYVCKQATTVGADFSADDWTSVPNNYIVTASSQSLNSTIFDIEGVDNAY